MLFIQLLSGICISFQWMLVKEAWTKDASPAITHKVFLDISIKTASGAATESSEINGRLILGLYGDVVPQTVENFLSLAIGDRIDHLGKPITFKHSRFHRIVKDKLVQGGDITDGNGTGGISIYGKTFADENFKIKHTQPYLLTMANKGKNTNGSQFIITMCPLPQMDGKNVVFGQVLDGPELLQQIANAAVVPGTDSPLQNIVITDCGEYHGSISRNKVEL